GKGEITGNETARRIWEGDRSGQRRRTAGDFFPAPKLIVLAGVSILKFTRNDHFGLTTLQAGDESGREWSSGSLSRAIKSVVSRARPGIRTPLPRNAN